MAEKSVLVAGAGISGQGAARLLHQVGRDVILYDGNENLDKEALKERLWTDGRGLRILGGSLDMEELAQVEYCVLSPGIPVDSPLVEKLKEMGIPVWSEIELAYHYSRGKLAGITGTNGKTTTTALVGQIVKNWIGEERGFVVGNIGIPYTSVALDTREDSITVAEISSFQLETVIRFHPQVSAVLNITPDHLNRHHTMENYAAVKESITRNQTAEDTCILNYEDEELRRFGETLKTRVVYFSSSRELEEGLYLKDGAVWYRSGGQPELIGRTEEFHLVGACNYENIMAAAGIALSLGAPIDAVKRTIREFRAVEHRIEFTAEKNGVKYYNDSKGTNVDAAVQGVKAMTSSTVLIGGGYDKGVEFDDWIRSFDGKIKKLLLMGQTREKIAACAEKYGFSDYEFVESMEEAVERASQLALPGEAVLLSPACASWGMFENYEQRGRIFKELVHKL